MKVKSTLAFTVDYAREFGGEMGVRIHKHFSLFADGKPMISPSIKWEYSRPERYMLDTCLKDKEGDYIFEFFKSRKEAHRWMEENWEKLTA